MFDPKQFTVAKPKPIPVCLLLDVSYSMQGDKINRLNEAVEQMLNAFAEEEKMETAVLVSIITFGEQVDLRLPFTTASHAQVKWQPMQVSGMTPMGTALQMAKAMIEDKNTTPSRAYRPTVMLVSDGMPNDDWEGPLTAFIEKGRSSKCDRMAMAIGEDADQSVLKKFLGDSIHPIFYAENAVDVPACFEKVTMSVTQRLHSKNPNEVLPITPIDDTEDDEDAFF
jgi:uncharacterized protein YegL